MLFYALKILIFMLIPTAVLGQETKLKWEWVYLKPIPDAIGYAGAYVGVVNDFLIVAGGANFPDGKAPWEGGEKVWTDKLFVLKEKAGNWSESTKLPRVMGYGATVSYNNKMYIAGGSDENQHLDSVYEIFWDNTKNSIAYQSIAKLPSPIANCASVRINNFWYILGGLKSPNSKKAENNCWRLDLQNPHNGWEICTKLPAEGRMLAVAANFNGKLLIMSGVSLINGVRNYLKDVYELNDDGEWIQKTNLPTSFAAAAGPAFYDAFSKNLFVIGGDDGRLAKTTPNHDHPGFSNRIFIYDGKEWNNKSIVNMETLDKVWVPVTTGTTYWRGSLIIPTGEIRPGIRSPKVLVGHITK